MQWIDTQFIAISGKRKSGKDYFATLLQKELEQILCLPVEVIHIAEPIKKEYAKVNELDLKELMTSSSYKEKYRYEMVRWGEEQRCKDSSIFCRLALETIVFDISGSDKPAVIIIADCRRPSDLAYFSQLSKTKSLIHFRIFASNSVRQKRGWVYTPGIDDAPTECALDNSKFDLLIVNENSRALQISLNSSKKFIIRHSPTPT